MISHAHSTIFIHIPKTGGQSIEQFFLALHGLSWDQRGALLLAPNRDPKKGPGRLAHMRANQYIAHGYVDRERFDRYFKFAFVRNPWDRLVSHYHFAHDGQKAGISFAEFVRNIHSGEGEYRRLLTRQVDFIFEGGSICLADFVGRFENLQQDFTQVCERLGIQEQPLPHRNPSRNRLPYQEYYNAETRALAATIYADDIEKFGYVF